MPEETDMPHSYENGARIVTLSWPDDPERGTETYGPFDSKAEQEKWVSQCQEAAAHGYRALHDVTYLLHRVTEPFDPTALWEQSSDTMKVEHA
jgi:hypothetical protein